MLRLRVTELAKGFWQAAIEGEEAQSVIDRAPDQALAGLVRANLKRFGVGEILYVSMAEETDSLLLPYSQGETVHPPDVRKPGHREEGG